MVLLLKIKITVKFKYLNKTSPQKSNFETNFIPTPDKIQEY